MASAPSGAVADVSAPVDGAGAEWEDMTEVFESARREMGVGEMIHAEDFSLFTAMSAIELMDPKMDIGCGPVRDVNEVELPEQLSDVQVLNIMDRLMACELSWMATHTLPQTVFSCVYLQRLGEVPRFELLAFIRLQLATMRTVREVIQMEQIASEEDFILWNYGFHLTPLRKEHDSDDGSKFVDAFIGEVAELTNLPASRSPKERALRDAITTRLRFRAVFYTAIQSLASPALTSARIGQVKQEFVELGELLARWKETSREQETDDVLLNRIFDPTVNRHLLTNTPPRTAPLLNEKDAFEALGGLLGRLQALCDLPGIVLPSDTTLIDKEEPENPRYSLHTALHSLILFSAEHTPCILTRSMMKRMLLPTGSHTLCGARHGGPDISNHTAAKRNATSISNLLCTDMGLTVASGEPGLREQAANLTPYVKDIIWSFCRNRGRQRRSLLRSLQTWDRAVMIYTNKRQQLSEEPGLESGMAKIGADVSESGPGAEMENGDNDEGDEGEGDAGAADVRPKDLFAGKTAMQLVAHEFSARIMVQHWLLGFECNLYQTYEYAVVFFYVGYVLTTSVNATASLANAGLSGASLHPSRYALYLLDEGKMWVSRALYSLLDALSLGDQWDYSWRRVSRSPENPEAMFGSEKHWYQQRFGVVSGLLTGPQYVDYQTFLSLMKIQEEGLLQQSNSNDLVDARLQDAAKCFLAARKVLERARKASKFCDSQPTARDVMGVARVAVANSLAVVQLLKAHANPPDSDAAASSREGYHISFLFGEHRHFPVVSVKPNR